MRHVAVLMSILFAAQLLGMQDGGMPAMPPSHPPVMPQGHPAVPPPSDEPMAETPIEANPADVESIEAVIAAYYDIISGEKGEARDWARFRTLFAPESRFITLRAMGNEATVIMLTPEQFIATNKRYFESGGYYEREVASEVETYGYIGHAFSTYETRRDINDPEPYSRGINSMQLIGNGQRWWIVTIMWDYERPDNPIPARYLSASDDQPSP